MPSSRPGAGGGRCDRGEGVGVGETGLGDEGERLQGPRPPVAPRRPPEGIRVLSKGVTRCGFCFHGIPGALCWKWPEGGQRPAEAGRGPSQRRVGTGVGAAEQCPGLQDWESPGRLRGLWSERVERCSCRFLRQVTMGGAGVLFWTDDFLKPISDLQ